MEDISLVIPVYNAQEYLPALFSGLQQQTYQGFRIIAIDDASTDNSYELLQELCAPFHARATILSHSENKGLSATRNTGLEHIRSYPSEYVCFCDADDVVDPAYLHDLHQKAQETGADLTIAGIRRFEEGSNTTLSVEMTNYPSVPITDLANSSELAYLNPCAYAKLFRFSCVQDLVFHSVKRSEDTCYFLEALPRCNTVAFTNHAYYHYRTHPASLSAAIATEHYQSMHDEFQRMEEEFSAQNVVAFREMVETQAYIHSSIGAVVRLSRQAPGRVWALAKEERAWLDKTLPQWRKNSYLSFGKRKSKTRKEFAVKMTAWLYKVGLFPLFVYVYNFVFRVMKKEIRA